MNSESRQKFFPHDAFISYAHRDNETGIVRALHAQLTEFLLHSFDWEPSVWLDERSLDVEANLETQIRAGLKSSAVLIIITSETVESRKWCRDEMGWFLTGADLEQVLVQRVYPIGLPFRHSERLPRWAKGLPTGELIWLDPERQELVADQDLAAHRSYWDQLYGWFERVSQGIVKVHSAYHQLEALAKQ